MMTEQKLVSVRVNPSKPEEAMERIHSTAGEGPWRIVSMISFDDVDGPNRSSVGVNDPARLQGRAVLVLLERDAAVHAPSAHRRALQSQN